jgi:Protein of unknown function (DUF3752)
LPPSANVVQSKDTRKRKRLDDKEEPEAEKTKYGPSPPPKRTSDSQIPIESDSDADSEPEVGPSISAMMTPAQAAEHTRQQAIERLSRTSPSLKPVTVAELQPKPQRDAWMLAPPTRAEWQNTFDPSKLKARKFAQSKSGTTLQQSEQDHSMWTETPQDRAQRLEDEALGKRPKTTTSDARDAQRNAEDTNKHRRIQEYTEKTRGPSLMHAHNATRKEDEDDPSKRPFDYQKDIAGGTMGLKERNAIISRAKNLDSKYLGGSYL